MIQKSILLAFSLVLTVIKGTAQSIPVEPPGRYISVNGHRIWVHVFGQGEPILFIPGGPGAAHHFWPDMNVFSSKYTLIYYDPFGRGKSDRAKKRSEYSFAADVDEVEGIRKALGYEKINIYGKSYGSLVAQGYALKYPAALSHLILAASFHSGEMWQLANNEFSYALLKSQYPEVWHRLDSMRRHGILSSDSSYQAIYNSVNDGMFYYYNPNNNATENFDINTDVYWQIVGVNGDVVIGGDIANLDFRPYLKNIKAPTLIVAGRFDKISTPEFALQYKTLMPRARFVMFEKSGHHPSIEEPQLHEKVVLDFLSDKP